MCTKAEKIYEFHTHKMIVVSLLSPQSPWRTKVSWSDFHNQNSNPSILAVYLRPFSRRLVIFRDQIVNILIHFCIAFFVYTEMKYDHQVCS